MIATITAGVPLIALPLAVLLAGSLTGADPVLLGTGATIGVLAALVQFLGLIRWPFFVPSLWLVATGIALLIGVAAS